MKITALSFFLLLIVSQVYGQFAEEVDTVYYTDRISGNIDSVDVANSSYASTFDGGVNIISWDAFSSQRFTNNILNPLFSNPDAYRPIQFSALPHVGFAYCFGGQGSQYLHATYSQALTKHTLLNLEYNKESSTGFIRNSDFSRHDVRLQFRYDSKRITSLLRGAYIQNDISHSSGLQSIDTLSGFDMSFKPIRNSGAFSKTKYGNIKLANYINLSKDSINKFGLTTIHDYSIVNREYIDNDYSSHPILYPTAKNDSTRDQYNLPSVTNGVGIFYKKNSIYVDAYITHKYWDYQNLGRHSDTNEVSLNSNFRWSNNSLKIRNELYFNLFGNFSAYSNLFKIQYTKGKVRGESKVNFMGASPAVYQREYYGNYYDYSLTDIQLTNVFYIDANVKYRIVDSILSAGVLFEHSTIENPLLFKDTLWSYDSQMSISQVGFGLNLTLGPLNVRSRFKYTVQEQDLAPDFISFNRIYLKGRLFEARKLEAALGVDVNYSSSFTVLGYNDAIDRFTYYNLSNNMGDYLNLNAFLSLGIEEFKFYVKFENIGYFWSQPEAVIVNQYPLNSQRLSIGLTWDFFN